MESKNIVHREELSRTDHGCPADGTKMLSALLSLTQAHYGPTYRIILYFPEALALCGAPRATTVRLSVFKIKHVALFVCIYP